MKNTDGLWKLTPSGLYSYQDCPSCFWLNNHIGRAPSIPLRLNTAVDEKLKSRYDKYRERDQLHPELRDKLKKIKYFLILIN